MKRFLLPLLALLLILPLTSCLAPPPYTEASFSVGPSQKHTIAVSLNGGQVVEGYFGVSGSEDYIDFYVKGPQGELAYSPGRVKGSHQFEARAGSSGIYTLYFDNSFSWGTGRDITLHYRTR